MAKIFRLKEFDFKQPDMWPAWKARFMRMVIATKLKAEEGAVQVSNLILQMGEEAEIIFTSFGLSQEDQNKLETVIARFDAYFLPQNNVIHHRAQFYRRDQKSGESVEEFIRTLHDMAALCNFGEKKDEQIRDRLVAGLADRETSRDLQLKGEDLKLTDAVTIARNTADVRNQDAQQRGARGVAANADEVRRGGRARRGRVRGRGRGDQSSSRPGSSAETIRCKYCNRDHARDREICPARRAKCRECDRKGHYGVCCPEKNKKSGNRRSVNEVDNEYDDCYYLDAVTRTSEADKPWKVKLTVFGTDVDFKIDTGADVSVLTEETWRTLSRHVLLSAVTTNLNSVGGRLECLGSFQTPVSWRSKRYMLRLYVVRGAANNLLSRHSSEVMGLVQRLEETVYGAVGRMDCSPVKIRLKPDTVPYSVNVARRVPIPLRKAVREELGRMQNEGVIAPITEATEWCSPMVPVVKPNNRGVRICVDLKRLNQAVVREKFILPTLEDVMAELGGATVFSSLDLASGFWAIPLEEESAKLTTFITPFGRFYFKRLVMGITSAPEIFSRIMSELLKNASGVTLYMDDVLVHGRTREEHDQNLKHVMDLIRKSGLKLNRDKCSFGRSSVEFLGHCIDAEGIRPSASRLRAVAQLKPPKNVDELKRHLGMINYLGRFVNHLATILKPLNDLLRSSTAWTWDKPQAKAFDKAKELLMDSPVLAYFDVNKPTVVSADSSSYGLGACLFQRHGDQLKPVAFASRTLTDAEKKYAQIEKECLASTWACEKFSKYLVGSEFELQTDHKPLVPLMMTKDIDQVPVRCQRLLLRLMRFSAKAVYVPGKDLVVADTLSRSPLPLGPQDGPRSDEVELFAEAVQHTAFSPTKLDLLRQETSLDSDLQAVIDQTARGWPQYQTDVPQQLQKYYGIRAHLSVAQGLLLYDDRIVVPETMQSEILEKIHQGHQGISKSRERARCAVFWLGMADEIKKVVENCSHCQMYQKKQLHEPLKPTPLPSRPWEKVGVDLLEEGGKNYITAIDYYSRYIEILYLERTQTQDVVGKLKSLFARWGVPCVLISDNGPQFASAEFAEFAERYEFRHITSSPRYPQSNGASERAVQVAKSILRQPDPFLGLMSYRSTRHSSTGFSPAQLLMGRNIRTTLPCLDKHLEPEWPNPGTVRNNDQIAKRDQKFYYDRHHGARQLTPLQEGERVRLRTDAEKSWHTRGTVLQHASTPRSVVIQTDTGSVLRRNRRHLRQESGQLSPPGPTSSPQAGSLSSPSSDPPSSPGSVPTSTQTRSGRMVKPVQRMDL